MNYMKIQSEDEFLTIEVKHSGQVVAMSYPTESDAWASEYDAACDRFDDVSYEWDDCDWDRLNDRMSSDCRYFIWMTREDAAEIWAPSNLSQENYAVAEALNEFLKGEEN